MSKYDYKSISEVELLIKAEIIAAKGATNDEMYKFFTSKDVKDLAQGLVKRFERKEKCTVLYCVIPSIDDPISGVKEGGYDWLTHFKPEFIKLEKEHEGSRGISVVIPDESIPRGKVAEYLFKLRKKPLENPLNYLLSLMKMFKEGRIRFPKRLINFEIIAYPADMNKLMEYPGSRDLHQDESNELYAIAVRSNGKETGIFRAIADPEYFHKTAFICEDLY